MFDIVDFLTTIFWGPDPKRVPKLAEKDNRRAAMTVRRSRTSAPPPAPLAVRNVSKSYRDGDVERVVLRQVTHPFQPGLTLVVGPSGSGKTTLLNLLAGLDQPSSGSVEAAGRPLKYDERSLATHRRRCAVVFQDLNLVPHLCVRENVALPLLIGGEPREEALRAADEALDDVDALAWAKRYPSQLSRGQRQRVAIGRASFARTMLADEPTASLDRESAAEMMELLRKLADQGRTIVVVSHDFELASQFANEVLECRDGVLTRRPVDNATDDYQTAHASQPPAPLLEASISTTERVPLSGDIS